MLLRFGCWIGYQEPDAFIDSKNLPFVLIQPNVIDNKMTSDLANRKIIQINPPTKHSISFFLGLIPKHNGSLHKIHYLSYSLGSSVNDYITQKFSMLSYSSLHNVFAKIVKARRHVILILDIQPKLYYVYLTLDLIR